MMLPHVMHTVEELSIVKDLTNWCNLNVQFIGKLVGFDGVYMSEGIEKDSSARVKVDFSLTAQVPPRNAVVRLWGELELKSVGSQAPVPVVKVKIARVISSVDIPLYKKSLEIRREYTSHHFAISSSTSKKISTVKS